MKLQRKLKYLVLVLFYLTYLTISGCVANDTKLYDNTDKNQQSVYNYKNQSLNEYILSISVVGEGSVTMNGSLCTSKSCRFSLKKDQEVNLVAIPAEDNYFSGWDIICKAERVCKFKIQENISLKANFMPIDSFEIVNFPDTVFVPQKSYSYINIEIKAKKNFMYSIKDVNVYIDSPIIGTSEEHVRYKYLPEKSTRESFVIQLTGPDFAINSSYTPGYAARLTLEINGIRKTVDFVIVLAPCIYGCNENLQNKNYFVAFYDTEGTQVSFFEQSNLFVDDGKTCTKIDDMIICNPISQISEEKIKAQGFSFDPSYRFFPSLWPEGIVAYEFDDSVSYEAKNMLLKAMEHIQQNTLIKFKKRTTETDYILFTAKENSAACWSYVGRIGGPQKVYIGCGINLGVYIHEIVHALGFEHEHQRPDRDNYIEVLWDNITEEGKNWYKKLNLFPLLYTTYDYYSIMHYHPLAFSKNGKYTFMVKDTSVDINKIGYISALSKGDIESINKLYSKQLIRWKHIFAPYFYRNQYITENIRLDFLNPGAIPVEVRDIKSFLKYISPNSHSFKIYPLGNYSIEFERKRCYRTDFYSDVFEIQLGDDTTVKYPYTEGCYILPENVVITKVQNIFDFTIDMAVSSYYQTNSFNLKIYRNGLLQESTNMVYNGSSGIWGSYFLKIDISKYKGDKICIEIKPNVSTTENIKAAVVCEYIPLSILDVKKYTVVGVSNLPEGGNIICEPNPVTTQHKSTCIITTNTGYRLTGVTGTCGGTLSGSTYTTSAITSDCNVVANFERLKYALTVSTSGSGSGTVTRNPDQQEYEHGTEVTLTATPSASSVFAGWGRDCSGCRTNSTCKVTMTSAKSCSATFNLKTYSITASASPSAGGSIVCTPNPVEHGSRASCTITTNTGYRLTGVTGTCGGTLSGSTYTTSAITSDCNVVANFEKQSTPTQPPSTGTGTGTTSGGGGGCFMVSGATPVNGLLWIIPAVMVAFRKFRKMFS